MQENFEFAGLNFIEPEKNQYAYRLDGFEKKWNYVGNRNYVTYTSLPTNRTFTLRIKAANNDGVWNEEGAELHFTILPPWWATWWAYALYLSVIIFLIYGLYSFQLRRQLALREASRLREFDQAKSRLYTNITHEFRTPLTLILGLTDQIRHNVSESVRSSLQIVERNARQLFSPGQS